MNYYIITGTSQGLGEAIAKRLISTDNCIFCISRKINEYILSEAEGANCKIEYYEYDLNCLEGIEDLVKKIFDKIVKSRAQSVSLISNAGILDPIKPIEKCESEEIIRNMKINAIAPMILNSQFIKLTEEFECKRSIINISSGAGRKPYYGWGCYCSSKSAIDMFTECIGVEETNKNNPVKIISFAPGVINTKMQKQIRESKIEDFEQVERFKKFFEDGVLKDPSFVAQKVVELLDRDDIMSGTRIDIKEL